MMPHLHRHSIEGGPAVWVARTATLPLTVGSFVLPAGATHDLPGRSGLAMLTGDALDTGTARRSLQDIADSLEFVGATVRTHVSHDGTVLTFSTVTKHLQDVFDVCADIWQHPVFPPPDVERLREQHLTSLLQQKDRPGTIASLVFHRSVFGENHPYGADAGGDEPGMRAITADDLRLFHATHFTPHRLTLIVVGDITPERVGPLAESRLVHDNGAATHHPSALPAHPHLTRSIILVDRAGAPQSEVRLGLPAFQRNSEDYIPAQVMNRILGGQFSSRLNANLREKRGLTYGAWSVFSALRHPGPFVAGGAFHTGGTAVAIRETLGEIDRMAAEGVTEDELTFAKESLAGSYALAFETPAQVVQALQALPLYDLPSDYYYTYLDRLRTVTREDVLAVARRYLITERMKIVVVGDAANTRSSLEALNVGAVETG